MSLGIEAKLVAKLLELGEGGRAPWNSVSGSPVSSFLGGRLETIGIWDPPPPPPPLPVKVERSGFPYPVSESQLAASSLLFAELNMCFLIFSSWFSRESITTGFGVCSIKLKQEDLAKAQ